MIKFRDHIWLLIFISFLFCLDISLTTLVSNLLPGPFVVSSSLFLIAIVLFSSISTSFPLVALTVCLGLCYDVYYFNIWGLYIILFPLFVLFAAYCHQKISSGLQLDILLIVILVFAMMVIGYLVSCGFGLLQISFDRFVYTNVAPSVFYNVCMTILLFPINNRLDKYFLRER